MRMETDAAIYRAQGVLPEDRTLGEKAILDLATEVKRLGIRLDAAARVFHELFPEEGE